jgi:ribosome-binding protein aMBF1 (putative translation factor)
MAKKKSAREVLASWCERRGRKVELARELSVNTSSVHRWCVGDATPMKVFRPGIERVVGIPRDAWEWA